ncbi:MAG: hypothetical protein IT452_17020 [Planctomycetia bacterium]|nr:hypothetical protein [Planctomycetia bacterium]
MDPNAAISVDSAGPFEDLKEDFAQACARHNSGANSAGPAAEQVGLTLAAIAEEAAK